MPISDEIIELEPVKKNKTKLILMFIAMGVLLALAATFLVLYIVKPSAEVATGKVNGIAEESTSLFRADGEGDSSVYYASVGHTYTVYATVSTEGDASKDVQWSVEPAGAVEKISAGTDPNDPTKCYYTFSPKAAFANGTEIVITARPQSDPNQIAQIKFFIKQQGTEIINIKSMQRGESGSRTEITGDTIELPYYKTGGTNNYYLFFDQFGAYDSVTNTYAPITIAENEDGTFTNKLDVTSDSSAVSIGVVSESADSPRIPITINAPGTAVITITANNYNTFAEPVTKTFTVKVVTSASLDVIEEILVSSKPVDKAFFKSNKNAPLEKIKQDTRWTTSFSLPYQSTYNDILKHIVLYPLSIQYNAETDAMREDWMSKLKFDSSDKDRLGVETINGDVVLNANRPLSDGNSSRLVITDISINSIGKSFDLKVKIFAKCTKEKVTTSLTLPSGETKNDSEITANKNEGTGFKTAQGLISTLTINYALEAPADTDVNFFMTGGYMPLDFSVEYDDDCLSIVRGEEADKGKFADPKAKLKSGVNYTFDASSVTVTHQSASSRVFTARAKLSILINEYKASDPEEKVPNSEPNKPYRVVFHKPGTTLSTAISQLDAAYDKIVLFDVEDIAVKASFLERGEPTEEGSALYVITDGGKKAGDITYQDEAQKGDDGIWTQHANIYVQNEQKDEPFPFPFENIIDRNDQGEVVSVIRSFATPNAFIGEVGGSALKFKGAEVPATASQATVEMTIKNVEGNHIATLTFNVFVIDPIEQVAVTNRRRSVAYGGTPNSDGVYGVDTVSGFGVEYIKHFNKTPTSATRPEIEIYYVDNTNVGKPMTSQDVTDGSGNVIKRQFYIPGIDEVALEYDGSRISQKLDFFKKSYENYHDGDEATKPITSKFEVYFHTAADERRIGDPRIKCYLEFIRKADGVGVYTDQDCVNELTKGNGGQPDSEGYIDYIITLNAGDSQWFYSAAKIDLGGGNLVTIRRIHVNELYYASIDTAYFNVNLKQNGGFTVNSASSAGGVKDEEKGDYYYAFINTPSSVDNGEKDYYMTVSSGKTRIIITVQDYTRNIKAGGIKLYTDEARTQPLDDNGALEFGLTSSDMTIKAAYSKTFYVDVTYEAKAADTQYTRFESLYVNFPNAGTKYYFSVAIEGINNGTPVDAGRVVLPGPTSDEAFNTDGEYTAKYKCTLKLSENAIRMNNSMMRVERTANNADEIEVFVHVVTALDKISYDANYTDDGKSSVSGAINGSSDGDLALNFKLINAEDTPSAQLALSYVTFDSSMDTENAHPYLEYDVRDLEYKGVYINGVEATSLSGLVWNVRPADRIITITSDPTTLRFLTQKTNTLEFKFVDKAPVTPCEISINVTVTVDLRVTKIDAPSGERLKYNGADLITNGTSAVLNNASLKLTFNEGYDASIISDAFKNKLVAKLYVKDGETYIPYSGNLIKIQEKIDETNNTVVFTDVSDSLLAPRDEHDRAFYVRVSYTDDYGTVNSDYIPVLFDTAAYAIRFTQGTSTSVDVKFASDTFDIHAEAYNRGTELALADQSGITINYAVYTDSGKATSVPNTVVNVDNGIVSIIKPFDASISGKRSFYLYATYTDVNGDTRNCGITVNYNVAVNTYSFKDGLGSSINLYTDGSASTYIDDIRKYIDVFSSFDTLTPIDNNKLTFTFDCDTDNVVTTDGYSVKFNKTGVGKIKLTISDGTTIGGAANRLELEFDVEVKDISLDALSVSTSADRINLLTDNYAANGKITVTPTVKNDYVGMSGTYALGISDERVAIEAATGDVKSVSFVRNKFLSEADYGDYELTASVSYVTASPYSSDTALVAKKPIKITAVCQGYTPEFAVKDKANNTLSAETDISKSELGDEYTVVISNALSDATYSAGKNNNMIEFAPALSTDPAASPIKFTIKENYFGSVDISLTARIYGVDFTETKTYTFTYGDHAVEKLYGAENAEIADGAVINVNFDTSSNAYKLKYEISGLKEVGNVTQDNVKISFIGDVTAGVKQAVFDGAALDKVYQEFTFDKSTKRDQVKFIVSATVTANGKTYFFDGYGVTLKAVEPEFEFNVDNVIDYITSSAGASYETAALSVTDNKAAGFMGDCDISYAVQKADGTFAEKNDVLEVKNSGTSYYLQVLNPITLTADKAVTVRATIRVNSGVFGGTVKTIDKLVTVKGVPLPELKWNKSVVYDTGTGSIDLGDAMLKTFVGTFDGYTYKTPEKYKYEIVDHNNLTENSDYTFYSESGQLIIDRTKVKAGGLITVRVSAVIDGSINNGVTVTSGLIDVVIKPQIDTDNSSSARNGALYVFGAAGSYSLKTAATLYTNGSFDGFIKEADAASRSVSLAFKSGTSVDGVEFDGDRIVLTKDFTSFVTVNITATVFITTGDYAGTFVSGDFEAYICGASLVQKTVSWDSGLGSYSTISAESLVSGIAEVSMTNSVSSVTVKGHGFYNVTDGENGDKIITVHNDANVSKDGSHYEYLSVTLSVTLDNGHVYFAHLSDAIKVASVDPTAIVTKNDTEDTVSPATVEIMESSDSLKLKFKEAHGLTISSLSLNTEQTVDELLTVLINGDVVTVMAGKATVDTDCTVKFDFTAGGETSSFTLKVRVHKAPDESGFKTTNTDVTLLLKTATPNVVSEWKPNDAMSDYMNPVSLTVRYGTKPSSVRFNMYTAGATTPTNSVNVSLSWLANRNQTTSLNSYSGTKFSRYEVVITVPNNNEREYDLWLQYTGKNASNVEKTVAVNYKIIVSKTVSVTFDLNGGEDVNGTCATQVKNNVTSGKTTFHKPASDPEFVGYTFVGWFDDPAEGNEYTFGETDRSANLYAHWTRNKVNVTFNTNAPLKIGSTTEHEPITVKNSVGATTTAEDCATSYDFGELYSGLPYAECDLYTFDGWFTPQGSKIDGNTVVGGSSAVNSLELIAHWTGKPFTVNFSETDCTVTPNRKTVTYGEKIGILPTAVRNGYTATGWSYNGTPVTEDSIICLEGADKANKSCTLTVTGWTPVKHTVTLVTGGGTLATKSYLRDHDAAYGALGVPQRTGYEFVGWFTEPVSGGQQITDASGKNDSNATYKVTGDITLYARYSQMPVTVTLNYGYNESGSEKTDDITETFDAYYTKLPTTVINAEDGNYLFVGWYTSKTGGVKVENGSGVLVGYEVTLYAHWVGKTVSVAFDQNHVSGSVTSGTQVYGDNYVLPATEPTRVGYRFDGWFTQKTGGTKVTAADKVTNGSDHTLYAHWTAKSYTITLKYNDGTSSTANDRTLTGITYDGTYAGLTDASRVNYRFDGWYTQETGGDRVFADTVFAPENPENDPSRTLYAHWTLQHKVTFDVNGGDGLVPSAILAYVGEPYGALPETTRTGYTFDGWTLAANGTDYVTSSSTFDNSGDQRLYAHWTAKPYTITLDVDGGRLSGSNKITLYYDEQYCDLETPVLDGYGFDGWFTQENVQITDGAGKAIDGKIFKGDITLTAHWTVNTYDITLVYGNGDADGTLTVTFAAAYSAGTGASLSTAITKNGYSFVEWNTKPDGSGNAVGADDIVPANPPATLYAIWSEATVSVTLNYGYNDGVSEKTETIDEIFGAYYTKLPTTVVNAEDGNYLFVGWYTEKTGGVKVENGSGVLVGYGVTLYAHWVGKTVSVAFDQAYVSGSVTSGTQVYGDNYVLPATEPTRAGYTFDGWFTAKTGGTEVTAADNVTNGSDHTLYAQWTAKTYTIVLKYNDGTSSTVNDDKLTGISYDGTYAGLADASRTGYRFDGWYTQETGGERVTADSIFAPVDPEDVASRTLYAHWTKQYIVSFDVNGSDVAAPTDIIAYVGEAYGVLPETTRIGYTFGGWTLTANGTDFVTASTAFDSSDDQTLYAHWTANTYRVTVKGNGGKVAGLNEITLPVTYSDVGLYGELPVPTLGGYRFDGWYKSADDGVTFGDKVESTTSIEAADITLYAKWLKLYKVTLDAGDGALDSGAVSSNIVANGDDINLIGVTASLAGYRFDGWYIGSTKVENIKDIPIIEDITLIAKYTELFTVSFDLNGATGSAPTSIQVAKDEKISQAYGHSSYTLPTPVYSGYRFDGWYTAQTGGTKVSVNTTVTSDLPVYAHWSKLYTISFNLNGATGTTPSSIKVANGDKIRQAQGYSSYALPAATRDGYDFLGWFTSANGGTEVTSETTVSTALTLYAHWDYKMYCVGSRCGTGKWESKQYTLKREEPTEGAVAQWECTYNFTENEEFAFRNYDNSENVWVYEIDTAHSDSSVVGGANPIFKNGTATENGKNCIIATAQQRARIIIRLYSDGTYNCRIYAAPAA